MPFPPQHQSGYVVKRVVKRIALPAPKGTPPLENQTHTGHQPSQSTDQPAEAALPPLREMEGNNNDNEQFGDARVDGVKGAISFSLFGNSPVYLNGAIRNAELASAIYPGWKCVFYCDHRVPEAVKSRLVGLGAEVSGPVEGIVNEMFWRFCINDEKEFTHFIVRDTDSRLSKREQHAVRVWIEGGANFHSMRDHPWHSLPIGGGLWGGITGVVTGIREKIIASTLASKPYSRETSYGLDQTFLTRYVWPVARKSCLQHDSCNRHVYPKSKPFPDGCKFGQYRFVGEVVDANDKPQPIRWEQRLNFMHV